MTKYAFSDLQKRAHKNSKDHGFWEASADVPTKLMLIVTEVAEAMEEYRNGMPDYYPGIPDGKPEGLAVELADAVIRIMDLAEYKEINLAEVICEKMDYNEGRPQLHGGKLV